MTASFPGWGPGRQRATRSMKWTGSPPDAEAEYAYVNNGMKQGYGVSSPRSTVAHASDHGQPAHCQPRTR